MFASSMVTSDKWCQPPFSRTATFLHVNVWWFILLQTEEVGSKSVNILDRSRTHCAQESPASRIIPNTVSTTSSKEGLLK